MVVSIRRQSLLLLETRYIKQTAQRLYDDFDSDVPKTVEELCSLPGVGPKMAFLALQVAWKLYVFFFFFRDARDTKAIRVFTLPCIARWN